MKFIPGLKMWSTNKDLIDSAIKLIDDNIFHYIELTPIPGTEIDSFLSYDIPYAIHITTERFGVNIADPSKYVYNNQMIDFCIDWANQLGVEYMILHPGYGDPYESIAFLDDVCDSRILIENMPKVGIHDEKMIGYDPYLVKKLLDAGDFGFCLDFNHAVKAAISMKTDYKGLLIDFMELKPKMFHISDGMINVEYDEHLNIGEGNYDLKSFYNCIIKNDFKYCNSIWTS